MRSVSLSIYQLPSTTSPHFVPWVPLIIAIVSFLELREIDLNHLVCLLRMVKTVGFLLLILQRPHPDNPLMSHVLPLLPLYSFKNLLSCAYLRPFPAHLPREPPRPEVPLWRNFGAISALHFPCDSFYTEWEVVCKRVVNHDACSQAVLIFFATKESGSSAPHVAIHGTISKALHQRTAMGRPNLRDLPGAGHTPVYTVLPCMCGVSSCRKRTANRGTHGPKARNRPPNGIDVRRQSPPMPPIFSLDPFPHPLPPAYTYVGTLST